MNALAHLCLMMDDTLEWLPCDAGLHTLGTSTSQDESPRPTLASIFSYCTHTRTSHLRVGVITFSQCAIPFQIVQSFDLFLNEFSLRNTLTNLILVALSSFGDEGLVQPRSEVIKAKRILSP